MPVDYVKFDRDKPLPGDLGFSDFKCIVLLSGRLDQAHMDNIINWLLDEGAVYVMAHGQDCEKFHDNVDDAVMALGEESRFVITTWHNEEPVSEVLWSGKHCADHPDFDSNRVVIVDTSSVSRRAEMLLLYNSV